MNKVSSIRDMIYSAIFAGIITVCAYLIIPNPFGPLPITLQTFGIILAGVTLSTRQTAFSLCVYLLLGAIGIPVFSGGKGGIGVFASPSGGYLLGFLIGAIIISLISSKTKNVLRIGLASLAGIIIIYTFGSLWLCISMKMSFYSAMLTNIPFIPGDLIKAFAATVVGSAVNRRIGQLSVQ